MEGEDRYKAFLDASGSWFDVTQNFSFFYCVARAMQNQKKKKRSDNHQANSQKHPRITFYIDLLAMLLFF
jgi:hypothetical protein